MYVRRCMPIAPSIGPRSASTLAHASSRDIIQPRPYPAWHPRGDFRKENAGWALSSPTRRWQVASAHTSILSGRTISCPNATHAATDCRPQSQRSAKRRARAHPALVYRHTPTSKPSGASRGDCGAHNVPFAITTGLAQQTTVPTLARGASMLSRPTEPGCALMAPVAPALGRALAWTTALHIEVVRLVVQTGCLDGHHVVPVAAVGPCDGLLVEAARSW